MDNNPHLIIGDQRVNVDAMSEKVEHDIAFLQERIQRLQQQSTPNDVVIKTYQSMLASRQSVLAWLRRHAGSSGSEETPVDGNETVVKQVAGQRGQ